MNISLAKYQPYSQANPLPPIPWYYTFLASYWKKTKLYCLFTCCFFYLQIPSFSTSPPGLPIISALTGFTPPLSLKIVISVLQTQQLSVRASPSTYQIHFCYLFICLFLLLDYLTPQNRNSLKTSLYLAPIFSTTFKPQHTLLGKSKSSISVQ